MEGPSSNVLLPVTITLKSISASSKSGRTCSWKSRIPRPDPPTGLMNTSRCLRGSSVSDPASVSRIKILTIDMHTC